MQPLRNQSLGASYCVQNKMASFIRSPNTGNLIGTHNCHLLLRSHTHHFKENTQDGWSFAWHTYLWGLLLHLTRLNTDLAKLPGSADIKSHVIRITEATEPCLLFAGPIWMMCCTRMHNRVYSRTHRISDPLLKCISILMGAVMRIVITMMVLLWWLLSGVIPQSPARCAWVAGWAGGGRELFRVCWLGI